MGKVLAAFEELGKPILWGMGWVNRRLGSFGGHPLYFDSIHSNQMLECRQFKSV